MMLHKLKLPTIAAVTIFQVIGTAKGENGIARVLSMLGDMKAKGESEKQEEAVKFSAFQSWCTSTKAQLSANIEKLGEEMDSNKNTIEAQTAKAKVMSDAIEKATAEVSSLTTERENKKTARAADHQEFIQVKSDYETSIAAIEEAIVVLKAQPTKVAQTPAATPQEALLELKDKVSKTQMDMISLLVEGAPPSAHAYENHSGGIIDILEDLKAKFLEELNSEISDESKKQSATDKQAMSLNGQIENLEEEIKRRSAAKGKHEKMAGQASTELTDNTASHETDSKSLSDVTSNCKTKDEEFSTRSEVRNSELTAIGEAINAIRGVSSKTTAAGLIQFKSKKSHAHNISFIQLQTRPESLIAKAMKYLRKQGLHINSKKIQLLAVEMAQNPFAKVMQMVETLIDKLKAESLAESGKQGQCNVMLSENKSDIETTSEAMDALTATIDTEQGTVGEMQQKIKDLSMSASDAAKMLAEAAKTRTEDSETNAKTIEDCKEGEQAIDAALQILVEFYRGAGATALYQVKSRMVQPLSVAAAPDTWSESSYTGNQQGKSDVVSLLEVIQADFLKLRSETEAAEIADKKAYDTLVNEQGVSSAERGSNLAHAKTALSAAKAAAAAAEKDLESQQTIMASHLEQKRVIEQVKGCLAAGNQTPDQMFQARVDARNAEIESLKNALEILKA